MESSRRTTCLFCGAVGLLAAASRESICCPSCNVSWRADACLVSVLEGLGYSNFDLIPRPDLSRQGIGISDDWRVARVLSSIFSYTNTFVHRFPQLDITEPPAILHNSQEFIVCSDVLEHVYGRVERAIEGLYGMLKPGGFLVVSVPTFGAAHQEFYPDALRIEVEGGTVKWSDVNGRNHVNVDPEFHRGAGLTLVTRQFTDESLRESLGLFGFEKVITPRHVLSLENVDSTEAGIVLARKA